MLDEYGHGFEVPEEYFVGADPIIAILPHPFHGRLVERVLLMVTKHITVKGMRYVLSWRDGDLAFYQPIAAH
jgi:hypothetical protein